MNHLPQTIATAPPSLTADSFARFSQLVTRELGIRMPPAKLPMLQSRLQRRLRQLQIESIEAYEDLLFHAPHGTEELTHFFDLVTTNKTDFFREPEHFAYLSDTALPALARELGPPAHWHFKLWCAGCSSGQEAGTLAMVLSEYAQGQPGFDFGLLATDISTRMLDAGRAAIYPEASIEPVPLALRQRYLLRSRDPRQALVRLVPALRAKIRFSRLNFMDRDYGLRTEFDMIFFRNVMIYFDKATQQAVVNRMCRHLRLGGYLFISHSESLAGLDVPLRVVGSSVFRKTR